MSHFVVMCLVPNDISPLSQHIERYLSNMLDPYDENTEMDEYEKDCSCCGDEARAEISKRADEKFGTWSAMRELFALEKTSKSEYIDAIAAAKKAFLEKNPDAKEHEVNYAGDQVGLWQRDYWGPRNKFEKSELEIHPGKDAPNPTCGFYSGERADWWPADAEVGDRFDDDSGCGGTGRVMSTYNPESRWDWWTIGGRWNGYFKPEWNPNKDEANLEDCIHCKGTGRRRDPIALGWERDQLWAKWVKDSGLTDEEKDEQMAFFKEKEGPLGFGQTTLDEVALLNWIADVPDPIGEPIGLAFRAIRQKVHADGRECNACDNGRAVKFPSSQEQRGVIANVTDVLKMQKEGHNMIPFAILTHREDYEGHQWMQQGDMGWFGMVGNEKDQDDWKSQVLQVLEDHIGDAAVIVDCHI